MTKNVPLIDFWNLEGSGWAVTLKSLDQALVPSREYIAILKCELWLPTEDMRYLINFDNWFDIDVLSYSLMAAF